MKTNCQNCGIEIDRRPCRIKKQRVFCGSSCQLKWEYANGIRDKVEITKRANEACRKKGLERFKNQPRIYINKRGYKMIYVPGVGNKKHHHYIWEKKHGKIPKGYAIHHINFNKTDNRLQNLIMLTHRDHHKLHDTFRERDESRRYL